MVKSTGAAVDFILELPALIFQGGFFLIRNLGVETMNNKKQAIRELIQNHGTIAQQLHQLRVSKQLSLERLSHDTQIPLYILDDMEIGRRSLQLSTLYILAKYYGKKIHIQLID